MIYKSYQPQIFYGHKVWLVSEIIMSSGVHKVVQTECYLMNGWNVVWIEFGKFRSTKKTDNLILRGLVFGVIFKWEIIGVGLDWRNKSNL